MEVSGGYYNFGEFVFKVVDLFCIVMFYDFDIKCEVNGLLLKL